MTLQETKQHPEYDFEINLSNEEKNNDVGDVWGCSYVWLGEDIGVEYNLCIEDDGTNCSAIYKMNMNHKTGYMETDTDEFIHYEVDFSDPEWENQLENAMCIALNHLHNL